MRRHVQRVRHRRRKRRVAARRSERLLSQRRVVVGVDDVVREARVLRMLLEERLENGRGFQLLRILFVGCESGLIHRERIEDPRFHVSRIRADDPLHRLFVRNGACALRRSVGAGIKLGSRGDERALARRRRACGLRLLNGGPPKLDLLRRAESGKRIAPAAERDAPVGHRAGGILRGDPLERGDRLRKPEGMQQRDRAVEVGTQGWRARRHEAHVVAADVAAACRVIVLREYGHAHDEQQRGRKPDNQLHTNLLTWKLLTLPHAAQLPSDIDAGVAWRERAG